MGGPWVGWVGPYVGKVCGPCGGLMGGPWGAGGKLTKELDSLGPVGKGGRTIDGVRASGDGGASMSALLREPRRQVMTKQVSAQGSPAGTGWLTPGWERWEQPHGSRLPVSRVGSLPARTTLGLQASSPLSWGPVCIVASFLSILHPFFAY